MYSIIGTVLNQRELPGIYYILRNMIETGFDDAGASLSLQRRQNMMYSLYDWGMVAMRTEETSNQTENTSSYTIALECRNAIVLYFVLVLITLAIIMIALDFTMWHK